MLNTFYACTIHESTIKNKKSSLLIPDSLLEYYYRQSRIAGSRSRYFSLFVLEYIPRINEWKHILERVRTPNWKTTYQSCDQNLLKKNFVPIARDWEAFRHAAAACGVSMCFLFVFLMSLEMAAFFQQSQPRPRPGRIRGWISSCLRRILPAFFRERSF